MGRERRIHHPGLDGSEQEIVLGPEGSRHLERVLRLGAGASVSVFDGRGREWRAEIVETGGPGTRLRLGEELRDAVESPLTVRLYQALCRHDRMEWVIQKGTELGFGAILGIPTERSEPCRVGPSRLTRWRRIAAEAARQSGRRRVPEVDVIDAIPAVGAGAAGILLHPDAAAPPLTRLLERRAPEEVCLAVGPEGGFGDGELERLHEGGWRAVRIGPRTLRTETAGLVAGALVLAAWGDLGGDVPRSRTDGVD